MEEPESVEKQRNAQKSDEEIENLQQTAQASATITFCPHSSSSSSSSSVSDSVSASVS